MSKEKDQPDADSSPDGEDAAAKDTGRDGPGSVADVRKRGGGLHTGGYPVKEPKSKRGEA